VGLDEADDVVALLGEREQCLGDRCDAGGGNQAFHTPLQLRQQLLELARGGVRGARVEEARTLATQVPFGVLERVELEFDRLVDRRHQRMVAGRQFDRGWMTDASRLFHDVSQALRRRAAKALSRTAASSSVLSCLAMHSRTNGSAGGGLA